MGLNESVKKDFSDSKKINLVRLKSIKIILFFSIFLFFSNFFILGTNVYFDYFKTFFPFTYFLLLVSLLYYFYFLIKVKFDYSRGFLYLIYFLLLLISILLFLPFVFNKGLVDVLEFLKDLYNKYSSIYF